MSIKGIELFHGVVFTKLLRSERPIILKLFEFNADKSAAAYLINDEVALYVKYSKTPQKRQRKGYQCVWLFSFSPNHLGEIRDLKKDKLVRMVLVCGDKNLDNSKTMQVCFLKPEEQTACIDLYAKKTQTITVANVKHGKLRVWGTRNSASGHLLVEKRRLEQWEVPGN